MIANLQSHYGFTRMPFTASVPVSALFASAAHKEAVARLNEAIKKSGQTDQRLFLEFVRDDWLRELPELRRRYVRRMARIIEVLRAHAAD